MEGKSLYDNILERLVYSDDCCQCQKKSRVKQGKMKIGAAQSNKVLSIIPLRKRIVRAFQTVSTKLGFPAFLS
jgi:CO/xanthine dehydrogenase FAD-binding subunit